MECLWSAPTHLDGFGRPIAYNHSAVLGHEPAEVGEINLYPHQYPFVVDRNTPYLGFVGGIGAGKTHALASWLAVKQDAEKGTGTIGGLFANTYQQLEQSTLPRVWATYEQLGMAYGEDYVYNEMPPRFWMGFESKFKRHNGVISCRDWGQVVVRSLDNVEAIRGIELGYAGQDEMRGATEDAFKVILGRLRCPRALTREFRGVTSPNGYDWIYDFFVEGGTKFPGTRKLYRGRTVDNTRLPKEYIESLLQAYDPEFARQELEGEFVVMGRGLVYSQFSRHVHVKKDLKTYQHLPWQVCFDFNRSPFCVVLCQTGVENGMHVVRVVDELRMMDTSTQTACTTVLDRLRAHGAFDIDPKSGQPIMSFVEVYADASGKSYTTKGDKSDHDFIREAFTKALGPRFIPRWGRSNPHELDRINAVNAMLKNALGQVRLIIHERCEYLRKDFERVTFVPGTRAIDKRPKFADVTHLSDALGYYLVDRYPSQGIRPAQLVTI
jgi:hypothetical protein